MALHTTLATCRELGVPLAEDKVKGPVPLLTFLDMELNTMTMQLRLPEDKLACLRDLLQSPERKMHSQYPSTTAVD